MQLLKKIVVVVVTCATMIALAENSPRTGEAPPLVVSWGMPRTATTLQFQILCAATCLNHGASTTCDFSCDSSAATQRGRPTVCKYHEIKDAMSMAEAPGATLYLTAKHTLSPDAESVRGEERWMPTARAFARMFKPRRKISFVQAVDALADRGYHIARDYQRALGMSDADTDALLDYIRYWDILRTCCGWQMSEDYRNRLHRAHSAAESKRDARLHHAHSAAKGKRDAMNANYKAHRKVDDGNYDACEIYDLGEVERSLMQTRVYREFGHIHSIAALTATHNTKPSVAGVHTLETFTGDWCVRTNALIYEKYLPGMNTSLATPVPPSAAARAFLSDF